MSRAEGVDRSYHDAALHILLTQRTYIECGGAENISLRHDPVRVPRHQRAQLACLQARQGREYIARMGEEETHQRQNTGHICTAIREIFTFVRTRWPECLHHPRDSAGQARPRPVACAPNNNTESCDVVGGPCPQEIS
jgi:hypothetical protein